MTPFAQRLPWLRPSGAFFAVCCLVAFALHLCALEAPPWMDEVHIVEMGRLALSGDPGGASILTRADGSSFPPLYYLGPCCHEWAFRLGGPAAVRLLPMLALIAAAVLCRLWLRAGGRVSPGMADVMGLSVLLQPLFVQSVRLVRADTAVLALAFATLALIDAPGDAGRRRRLAAAGALAGLSPFIWPTAILLFPLYGVAFLARIRKRALGGDLLALGGGALVAAGLALLPVRAQLTALIAGFGDYFRGPGAVSTPDAGFQPLAFLRGCAVLLVKESLRNPFLFLLAPVGFVWACRRRRLAALAFLVAFAGAAATKLHTFRFLYLYPYTLMFFLLGAVLLARRARRLVHGVLALSLVYGFVTGPVAYAIAAHGTAARGQAFCRKLAETVGSGPLRVLTADYRTYYLGRQLGWRQSAYPEPTLLVDDAARLLPRADIVIEPAPDPFTAIEESHTLYGLIRDRALDAARREVSAPAPSALARVGLAFLFNHFTDETVAGLRAAYARNGLVPAETFETPGFGRVRLFRRTAKGAP